MDELIAFLRARLAEDEAAANAILEDPDYAAEWHEQTSGVLYVGPGSERYPLDGLQPLGDSRLTRFMARHDPARVLRQVEALRAILSLINNTANMYDGMADRVADGMLRALAAVWSDHPDYRPGWKP